MKGFQIFGYAVRQVFRNLQGALLISVLPALLSLVSVYMLNRFQSNVGAHADLALWLKFALILAFPYLLLVWVAVNWHRHILQKESVGVGLPPIIAPRIRSYLLASLLVAICVLLPLLLAQMFGSTFITMLTSATGAQLGVVLRIVTLIEVVSAVAVGVVSLRASIFLPGVAVGKEISMADGWNAVEGQVPQLTVIFLCSWAISFGIDLIGATKLFYSTILLGWLWQIAGLWLKTMLGLSLLTTLYGHYVEKRPLV